jgi:hypothetical protein
MCCIKNQRGFYHGQQWAGRTHHPPQRFGEVNVLWGPNRIALRAIELLMHWAPAKVWVIILTPFRVACRWVSFLPLKFAAAAKNV